MTNKLSDYQKEVFLDLYKTSLSALLSTEQNPDSISINTAVSNATKIAFLSLDLITNENGIKKPSEIIDTLQNESVDKFIDYPEIED